MKNKENQVKEVIYNVFDLLSKGLHFQFQTCLQSRILTKQENVVIVGEINVKSDKSLPTFNYCFLPW